VKLSSSQQLDRTVFYRTAAHLVVLSLDAQAEQALLDKIGHSVRKLELAGGEGETEKGEQP
jgi:hypothetical protein